MVKKNSHTSALFHYTRNQNIVINPSLTPIVVESRCYFTFEVLAMNSVSYKFLFF